MKLTDEDLSRIRGVLTDYCDMPEIIEQDRALYLAGMRAGIERAIKACESLIEDIDTQETELIRDCANAIRALLSETAGESPAPPQP